MVLAQYEGFGMGKRRAGRGDARFQPSAPEDAGFMPVEVARGDGDVAPALPEAQPTQVPPPPSQIEITLENGRKLRVSNGVHAGFVLELARGLAA